MSLSGYFYCFTFYVSVVTVAGKLYYCVLLTAAITTTADIPLKHNQNANIINDFIELKRHIEMLIAILEVHRTISLGSLWQEKR